MGRRKESKAYRANVQADVTSSSGEEEYHRTLDIINRLSKKYLKHDKQEDLKASQQRDRKEKQKEDKLQGHSTKLKPRTRYQRKVRKATCEVEEACLYDGDIENNTGTTSQSEDASMKSASDDLYEFEQSDKRLQLGLSPENKKQRLTELQKPSTKCRPKNVFSRPKKKNVAANECKTNQVRLTTEHKRGTKIHSGRKRLRSSDDNADVSLGSSKQRTSVRLARNTVTKGNMLCDDSGLVMSPPVSTHLSLRSRSVICTPGLVSTSTPNAAIAMQTNTGSSDNSCFGFKYLMPSVSLGLSPVEALPSSRVTPLVPDDSGISLTPSCEPSNASNGKTQKEFGMFDKPIEKKPVRKRPKKNKLTGPSPEEVAAQMNAEFDDLEYYELSVEVN